MDRQAQQPSTRAALAGLRIVEWGAFVAAPYCAKLLADFGAHVLKVEEAPAGDPARYLPPFASHEHHPDQSGLFQYLNGNKQSVLLDVEAPAGRAALRALIADADILIHSQSPRRIEALGFGFPTLAQLNPGLVMTAVTPFGSTGPYRDWKACNMILCHLAGVARTTWPGMDPRLVPPLKPAGYYADFTAGAAGALASLGGLMARDAQGEAQYVDVSTWESAFLTTFPSMMTPPYEGRSPDFRQPHRPSRGPMGYMKCSDGYVWVAALQPRHWEGLTRILGVPELADEPLFATPMARGDYWDVLEPILTAKLMQWTKDDLFHACQAIGVPVVPAYDMREAIESEQVQARKFMVAVEHPVLGRMITPGNPCRLSESPPRSGPAPSLGQHTERALTQRRPAARMANPIRGAAGERPLPLAGIRVLDLAWVLAGPLSSQILCRLGAEVIKVESERVTDIARVSPPFANGENHPEKSGYYAALAVGKKTCTIDVSKPAGLAIVQDLVRLSDVVVENFSPGTLERLGLGYQALKRLRPDVILVSVSALGQTGPLTSYRAFGLQLFAMSGLSVLSSQVGAPPAIVRGGGADPATGLYAALATLLALQYRARTGQGQHIDISMLETTMAHLPDAALEVTLNDRVPQPVGNAEFGAFPVDAFPCRGTDNWVAIAVHDDAEWAALCRTIGAQDLLGDVRFSTPEARAQQRDEVARRIGRWTSGLEAQTAMELLQAAGVPAGVSYDDAQIQANPHFRERGFMELVDHHVCGERFVASVPWTISGVPAPPRLRRVPQWGEHNQYVLHELLQLPQEHIDTLIADGIVSGRT